MSPRTWIAILMVSHLALAAPASAAEWWSGSELLGIESQEWLRLSVWSCLYGFQLGQISLLLSWGAFSSFSWFFRIPRFLILAAWFLLLRAVGDNLAVGDVGRETAAQLAAFSLFLAIPSCLVLFGISSVTRKRFLLANPGSQPPKFQFKTLHLLLLTAEAATLLAIARIVIPWSPRLPEQFWEGISSYRWEELVVASAGITVLPIVLLGLSRVRGLWRYALLAAYSAAASAVLGYFEAAALARWAGPVTPGEWQVSLLLHFGSFLATHLAAAVTILFTFWLVRRIGYDFRRRELPGRGPEGRDSSNARSSAASASA